MHKYRFLLVLILLIGLVSWSTVAQDVPQLEIEPLATLSVKPDQDMMILQPRVAWSPDGTLMAVISDGIVQLWEAETGSPVAMLELDDFEAVAFNVDGSLLAVAGKGGNVLVAYIDVLREVKTVTSDTIEDAVFNKGLLRNFVQMYGDDEKKGLGIFNIAFSLDSSVLLVSDGLVPRLWDISDVMDFSQFDPSGDPPEVRELRFSVSEDMRFEPHRFTPGAQGFYGLSFERDKSEMTYRLETLQIDLAGGTVSLLPNPPQVSLDTSQQEMLIWADAQAAVIQTAGGIRMVSWESGEDTTLTIPPADSDILPLRGVAVNHAETLIVTVHVDGSLHFWDTDGIDVLADDLGKPVMRNGLVFSPDDSKLAMIAAGEGVVLFSLSGELAAPPTDMAVAVSMTDSGCDIDLSEVVALLVQAQDAAADDADSTAKMLAEARTRLQVLEAECGGETASVPDTQSAEPMVASDAQPLTNTYTIDSRRGALAFAYPEGWLEGEAADDNIIIGSNAAALDHNLNQPEVPPFAPGEVVMNIALADTGTYGLGRLGDSPDVLAMLEGVLGNLPDTLRVTVEPTRLTINDRPAAQANLVADNAEVTFLLVDLGNASGEEKQFGAIIAVTAPGELADMEAAVHAMAESFKLN